MEIPFSLQTRLTGKAAAWAVKKQCSHHAVSEQACIAMEKLAPWPMYTHALHILCCYCCVGASGHHFNNKFIIFQPKNFGHSKRSSPENINGANQFLLRCIHLCYSIWGSNCAQGRLVDFGCPQLYMHKSSVILLANISPLSIFGSLVSCFWVITFSLFLFFFHHHLTPPWYPVDQDVPAHRGVYSLLQLPRQRLPELARSLLAHNSWEIFFRTLLKWFLFASTAAILVNPFKAEVFIHLDLDSRITLHFNSGQVTHNQPTSGPVGRRDLATFEQFQLHRTVPEAWRSWGRYQILSRFLLF